ncbi:MAG: sulfatase [Thermoanaerobaculia bacterium]
MKPTRRDICRWGLTGLAAAGLPALGCTARSRPNVLFIAIDDLNNWPACLGGHPDALSPNLDALAASGRLFKRAYSPGTNCNGTRTAVLSGVRPSTSGVYANRNRHPEGLLDGSIPVLFRQHGYRLVAGGKVFHRRKPELWDKFFYPEAPDLFQFRAAPDEYGYSSNDDFNWGPVRYPEAKTWDGRLARWAGRQLEREYDRPFFLAVGFFEPHLPWWVPERYFRPFPLHKVTLPESDWTDLRDIPRYARLRASRGVFLQVVRSGQWRQAVASYLAATYFVDAMVGRVLDALDSGPHADNTIVVLWSDHGFGLGQKRNWHKYLLWEHTTQVPFIIRAPQQAQPGAVCMRPVDLMHIYPTLVELCDLPMPAHLEGRSLRPLLDRHDADWPLPAISTGDWGSHAVRTDRWRFIRYGDGSEELYDHSVDTLERVNLATVSEHAEVKEKLAAWFPEPSGADIGA